MKRRVFFGMLAALFSMALIFKAPYDLMMIVAFSAACLSYIEYDELFFTRKSTTRLVRMTVLISLAIVTLRFERGFGWVFLSFPLLLLSIRHIHRSNQEAEFKQNVQELSLEILGFIYIVSLLGFLVPIAEFGLLGRHYLFLLFMIVFGGDTGGYFVGTLFGKHRLASHLSPKKSLEGAAGGLLTSLGMAWIWLNWIYPGEKDTKFTAIILIVAAVTGILGQVGDLFESLLKRSQSKKDSGKFLPGHGGILDRIDGLALAAPAFYFFLTSILDHL